MKPLLWICSRLTACSFCLPLNILKYTVQNVHIYHVLVGWSPPVTRWRTCQIHVHSHTAVFAQTHDLSAGYMCPRKAQLLMYWQWCILNLREFPVFVKHYNLPSGERRFLHSIDNKMINSLLGKKRKKLVCLLRETLSSFVWCIFRFCTIDCIIVRTLTP